MGARIAAVLAAIVTALACLPLGGAAGWWWGHAQGVAHQRGQQAEDSTKALSALITSHEGLIDQANQASTALRRAQAARRAADDRTTKELTDALTQTAADRAACRYGNDVMRQLAAARDRAAQAASGGVGSGMPAAHGDAGRQP